ncbi:MAG TPA: Glu/Leu/Phe/Val dehydrogenase dimerization domain-containing protein [Acidimicrobiales bacterium]|nr:Glu/Leu/Phe/Val dehydrogenase dimerization domain-containing protein [Acidimicrobiales bacterium]
MSVFERLYGHEEVVYFNDPATGLRAIVAIYSTTLGPALGGTRFLPYENERAALEDVLKLARAMAYKSACAGLDLGGGKAVIIGDPTRDKSEALLRAYGRFLQTLGGRYYTACDVGTYVTDMDVVAQECAFVTGRSSSAGGAGDSSVLTAVGVFEAMRAAAQHVWKEPSLRGRRVGVVGVGKVGSRLAAHLLDDGATVFAADVQSDAVERLRVEHPDIHVATPDELSTMSLDVYAPCALGDALTQEVVATLGARIVCGGANNQLAADGVDKAMADRGIVYVPDFVANAGGVIQVAIEACGYPEAEAQQRTAAIFETTRSVLAEAANEGLLPAEVAERRAEVRMRGVRSVQQST